MSIPSTYKGVIKRLKDSTHIVRKYFEHLPKLAGEFPWEVSLAYLFAMTERAHNDMIYGGVVKLHLVDKDLAESIVQRQHMTRDGFLGLFAEIFGKQVPKKVLKPMKEAERIRDRAIHGKKVSDSAYRTAVVRIIEYAEAFNAFARDMDSVEPFGGDWRGFKGRAASLGKGTSRLVLKGLGFHIKSRATK